MKKFSPNWDMSIAKPDASLKEALINLNESGLLVCCFLDDQKKIKGILTDSDVRRALVNGARLEDSAFMWCNKRATVAHESDTVIDLQNLAYRLGAHEIPLVDDEGRLSDIYIASLTNRQIDVETDVKLRKSSQALPNYMFILAGGLGSRLKNLVSDRPKPLAVVGSKPLLGTVIQNGVAAGIENYYISVNFMSELIEEYLNQDEFKHLNIQIVREDAKLGTAGSIGYVAEQISDPLVVCNADVLTTTPINKLLRHHTKMRAAMTCAVRPHTVTIPFGVSTIENEHIVAIEEKPEHHFLINAGLYVLDPDVCRQIKKNQYLDMPNFCNSLIKSGKLVAPYYIHEYWIDVGRPEEFLRANSEYHHHFGKDGERSF